jgi:ATP-binding cassette subfamily B protein
VPTDGAGAGRIDVGTVGAGRGLDPGAMRLAAVVSVARHNGMVLTAEDYPAMPGEAVPSAASLVAWLRESGLWAKAVRLRWKQLMKLHESGPVILLLNDGSAGLLRAVDPEQNVVLMQDPTETNGDAAVPVDELRLAQLWSGEVLMIRRERSEVEEDQPFTLSWLIKMVMGERRILRDIGLASITLSLLTIIPPLLVLTVVDRVVVHHSMSTLVLLTAILVITTLYEMFLGSARRLLVLVIGTRLDAKLNLYIFNRLLRLPLDFFERHSAGETTYKVAQIYRVREFLTGRLMNTFLDMFTLLILLPFLFWLDATLAWMVVAAASLIALVILAFLHPMRVVVGHVINAETLKNGTLIETVHGIRTVKSLALEPARRAEWDERVANVGKWRLAAGRLANWPATLVTPLERFISIGVIMVGVFLALDDSTAVSLGALMAFMMLGMRVAGPLVQLARLIEDLEEARNAVGQVGAVLNRPMEANPASGGMRPKFTGAISFDDVTYTYPNTKTPALDRVTFSIPAGTMLGVVGRSGSGKSTLTRLLQGITRDYTGFLKIDNADLREINLQHLRRSFGTVLQENFLFRGSIRDNIIAGRAGLTLDDVVRACRLAGAEEFIERMPAGYETWIEEGSPNLSGGQRQRLAIARAVICDPKLMIMDEATSALDPESEALVNANLLRIARGRTMVIVSHRLSSLTECDLILVMDKGRVIDVAPHRMLLERCAIYRQLWLQQTRHMDTQGPRNAGPAPILAQGD